MIGKFLALIGSAGKAAVSDAKKIERHGVTRCNEGRSRPMKSTKSCVSGFRNAGQINPGIYGVDAGHAASAPTLTRSR